ncbi:hypothetical protein [uncultured Vagococcus sp.]|uniref:hypothetical protein n=1 Tax=uncultured Vagococcus sp. TaxID=189676 RepID=UPI00258FA657|nr:hypothetical protein [uncultured Vagococcus sp.]
MKKKTKLALTSLVLAGALAATGTFAWTSMSQRAINEAQLEKQPGGRIHDDYQGVNALKSTNSGDINKDIYAENYSNKPLYVRVRLTEFYEEGEGAGKYVLNGTNHIMEPSADNKAKVLPKSGLDNAKMNDRSTWPAYLPNGVLADSSTSDLRKIITWKLGDSNQDRKVYMPTFNQNNMNLSADVTGEAIDELTWEKNIYYDSSKELNGTQDQWQLGETHTSTLFKNDGNNADSVETPGVVHTAKQTVTPARGGYMTMTDWVGANKPTGNFWVHDTDGWMYWASELAPYTATSLLLDQLHITVPQNDFYYAINVISDFSTVEDLNQWTGTSTNANDLLNKIKASKE